METDEGTNAPRPCSWCSRPGVTNRCAVFRGKAEACAYCKVMSRARCSAIRAPEPPSLEELIAQLERNVDECAAGLTRNTAGLTRNAAGLMRNAAGIAENQAVLDRHSSENRAMDSLREAVVSDMYKVWKALGFDPDARGRPPPQRVEVAETEVETNTMEE